MPIDLYDYLPPERAKAIRAWLNTPLNDCCICGDPVYPTDSRQLDPAEPNEDKAELVHVKCLR